MFLEIGKHDLLTVRFVPAIPISKSLHLVKGAYYSCPRYRDSDAFCQVCELRSQLYREAESKETRPQVKKANTDFARVLRPIVRHYVPAIDRNQPEGGVKILVVSDSLYKIICAGIVEHPCPPSDPKWWHIFTRLKNWWFGYRKPTSAIDEQAGVDFVVHRTMRQTANCSFPDYSHSKYLERCSPLGTKEQCKQWKEQAQELLKNIHFKTTNELTISSC